MKIASEELIKTIIDACYQVQRKFGPGMLESLYEAGVSVELQKRGIKYVRQQPIKASYLGTDLGIAFGQI